MDYPPHHYYHHHYDPTTINTHTLLKAQAYQQSTHITTHIQSHPHTYTDCIALNSTLSSTHNTKFLLQQLLQSQQACIHTISSLVTDISTLNKSLTPPSFPDSNSTTSLTPFLYHQPLTPSNISPPNFTYQQPHITTTTVINHNSQHCPDTFPPPLKISTHLYNSNHVITEIDAATTVILPDLITHADPISHVDGEHHAFVAKDFNIVAPSKRELELTTTGSTETDERSRDDIVTVKGQEDNRNVPPSISQSPCDSDRIESLTIQSIVDVPIGLVPAKHRSITTTRPSILPYRFTIMTRSDGNTLFGETKQHVLNHELSVNNFECSFDFPVVCTFNFDYGGDKSSAAANYGGNSHIFSLLWLPWDRGKSGVCSFLSLASELSGISSNPSLSFLWEPWDRGKKSCGEAVCSAELFGKKKNTHWEKRLSEWALLFGNSLGLKITTRRK